MDHSIIKWFSHRERMGKGGITKKIFRVELYGTRGGLDLKVVEIKE